MADPPRRASPEPPAQAEATPIADPDDGSILADLPLLTCGLLGLLALVFVVEQAAAFGGPGQWSFDALSLMAFGGVNGARVLGAGEAWRLFTAPLLHASASHLIGNAFVLFLIGYRLERLLGRSWFAAIFALSALAGSAASVLLNPGGPVSVGASGAIMGLLGAAIIGSYHPAAFEDGDRMRQFAFKVMIPSLVPTSGHVDYSAHLGGALAGVLLGAALHLIWPEMQDRPRLQGLARIVAALTAMGSLIAAGFAWQGYGSRAAHAADLASEPELKAAIKDLVTRAPALRARYPRDPRVAAFAAGAAILVRNLPAAEQDAREGLAQREILADLPPNVEWTLTEALVFALMGEGRIAEARAEAKPLCTATHDKATEETRRHLQRLNACE